MTCNGGAKCCSWFDVLALSQEVITDIKTIRKAFNQDDIMKSVALINDLIEKEVKNLPN
jgi:negative regulator of replication initiation